MSGDANIPTGISKRLKRRNDPSTRERAVLTRIYGDESNWLGVPTRSSGIRRKEARQAVRKSTRGDTPVPP